MYSARDDAVSVRTPTSGIQCVVDQRAFDEDIIDVTHVDRIMPGPAHFAVSQGESRPRICNTHRVVGAVLAIEREAIDGDVGVIDSQNAARRCNEDASWSILTVEHDAVRRVSRANACQ